MNTINDLFIYIKHILMYIYRFKCQTVSIYLLKGIHHQISQYLEEERAQQITMDFY